MTSPVLFKTRVVAEFFGTATDFVVDEIRSGRLPCARQFKRQSGRTFYLLEFDEVRAYCEAHCQRLIPRLDELLTRHYAA